MIHSRELLISWDSSLLEEFNKYSMNNLISHLHDDWCNLRILEKLYSEQLLNKNVLAFEKLFT